MADQDAQDTSAAPGIAAGAAKLQMLMDAGATPNVIQEYRDQATKQLMDAGAPTKTIDEYWGNAAPDMRRASAQVAGNIGALDPGQKAKAATDLGEAAAAGWQASNIGMLARGAAPDMALPENATMGQKITAAFTQVAGDVPTMVLGAAVGSAVGGTVGGAAGGPIGAVVGAGVGSGAVGFALPALTREILMDHYANPGGHKDWASFWAATAPILTHTAEQAAIGAVTLPIGGAAGAAVARAGGGAVMATGANLATQVGAATSIGAALEGHVPNASDFIVAGATIVGLHAAGMAVGATSRFVASPSTDQVAENLRDIYARTGLTPQQVVLVGQRDMTLLGEVLAPRNVDGELRTPGLDALAPPEPDAHTPEDKVEPPRKWVPPATEAEPPDGVSLLYRGKSNNPITGEKHDYEIRKGGLGVANARVTFSDDGKTANIDSIDHQGGPNQLGPKEMRTIARQFFEQNPDVQTMQGERVSGARTATGGGPGGASVTREQVGGVTALIPYAKGNAVPGGLSPVDKIDPDFAGSIASAVKAMPDNIRAKFEIISGFRDPAREAQVYREQHPGKHVPEHSQHSDGMAVDIGMDPDVIQWITDHPEHGIGFPLAGQPGEANHMEPIGPGGRRITGDTGHGNALIAPMPADVTDQHLAIFSTLEGSADDAVSPAGARSKYQIMPDTARQYGFDPAHLDDPEYAKTVAKAIVSDLSNKFHGNLQDMLVAYNAGPGRARSWIAGGRQTGDLPVETQRYLERAEAHGFTRGDMIWRQASRALTIQGDDNSWVPPDTKEAPDALALRADEFRAVEEGGSSGGGLGPPRAGGDIFPPEPGGDKIEGEHYMNEAMRESVIGDIIGVPDEEAAWYNPRRVIAAFRAQLRPAENMDKALKAAGELLPGQVGIEDMFRQTYAAKERAGVFLQRGVIRPTADGFEQASDASYRAAYQAARDDGGTNTGFIRWRMAERTVEKAAQGIDTGVDLGVARMHVNDPATAAKYARASAILNESKDGLVDYARDSGLFSAAGASAMKGLNRAHIVFRRIMDPDYTLQTPGQAFGVRTVRKMEGSDRKIIDAATADVDNYHTIVAMADRNRAVGSVINVLQGTHRLTPNGPEVRLLWHDRTKGSPSRPTSGVLDERGNVIPPAPEGGDDGLGPFLAERSRGSLGPNEFAYFRDGVREVWRARSPELAALMRNAGPIEYNPMRNLAVKIASVQRLGIVSTPGFLRNAFTHGMLSSSAWAEGGTMVPFRDLITGVMDAARGGEWWKTAEMHGAMAGAFSDIDVNYIKANIASVWEETGSAQKVLNSFEHPLDALRAAHHWINAASRVGFMKRNANAGLSELKAATLARTGYLDHAEGRALSVLNAWARATPFMEVGFKDVEQVERAFVKNPYVAAARAATVLTTPALMLYAANYLADIGKDENDPTRYDQIPRWERDMYFITPALGGVRFKITKPYVGGWIFATLPERTLEALRGHDTGGFDEWAHSFIAQVVPPFMPTIVQPLIENWANKHLSTGQALVPASLEARSGYMQYTPATTETAKAVARILGPPGLGLVDMSPMVAENYVRQWTGQLPFELLKALETPAAKAVTGAVSDAGGPIGAVAKAWAAVPEHNDGCPKSWVDTPFVSAFMLRQTATNAQSIEDFYTAAKEVKAAHEDVKAAIEQNRMDLVTDPQIRGYAARLQDFEAGLSTQRKALNAIYASGATDDEKRAQTDSIVSGMIAEAKAGSAMIKAIRWGR